MGTRLQGLRRLHQVASFPTLATSAAKPPSIGDFAKHTRPSTIKIRTVAKFAAQLKPSWAADHAADHTAAETAADGDAANTAAAAGETCFCTVKVRGHCTARSASATQREAVRSVACAFDSERDARNSCALLSLSACSHARDQCVQRIPRPSCPGLLVYVVLCVCVTVVASGVPPFPPRRRISVCVCVCVRAWRVPANRRCEAGGERRSPPLPPAP